MTLTISSKEYEKWQEFVRDHSPYKLSSEDKLDSKDETGYFDKLERFREFLKDPEVDPDFSWINNDDVEILSATNQPSLKYGFPALPAGDPVSADFIIGLVNPSVPKVVNAADLPNVEQSIKAYYENGYDEIEISDEKVSEYNSDEFKDIYPLSNTKDLKQQAKETGICYNPTNIVAQEFERAFSANVATVKNMRFNQFMSSSAIPGKKEGNENPLRQKKMLEYRSKGYKFNKMYYVHQYFNQALVPVISDLLASQREKKVTRVTELNFEIKDNKGNTGKNTVEVLKKALQSQNKKFDDLNICNIELFPYRSRKIPKDAEKLPSAQFSVALLINRIFEYLVDAENNKRPILALRNYENRWLPAIEQFIIEHQAVLPAGFTPDEVEQFVWVFSSNQSVAVSDNNLIYAPIWYGSTVGKHVGKQRLTNDTRELYIEQIKKDSAKQFASIVAPVFKL